ncbi:MAG: hypothetical protein ACP5E5_01710 [Acidobacteriaceae bacterium]
MPHLSGDSALLMVALGVLLIYLELNRPGWIVSGVAGLLCVLLGVAAIAHWQLNPAAVGLLTIAFALLLLDLVRRLQIIVSLAATLALVLGFAHLVLAPSAARIHTAIAVGCGVTLGVGTSILTRIARRARTNKGLD